MRRIVLNTALFLLPTSSSTAIAADNPLFGACDSVAYLAASHRVVCLVVDPVDRDTAEGECVDAGFDGLVTVRGPRDNRTLVRMMDGAGMVYSGSGYFWLGAAESGGSLAWDSGIAPRYSNWNSGEPNTADETGVVIYGDTYATGYWNDFGGSGVTDVATGYFCESAL